MGRYGKIAWGCAAFLVLVASEPAVAVAPANARVIVSLNRLHDVAQREIQLGLLCQVAALHPETIIHARELETGFRALDRRIVAFADDLGMEELQLRAAYARENEVALRGEVNDIDALAMILSEDFDREYWVFVVRDHQAASDLLLSVAGTDRRLDALIAEVLRLLDRSSRTAIAAVTSIRPSSLPQSPKASPRSKPPKIENETHRGVKQAP